MKLDSSLLDLSLLSELNYNIDGNEITIAIESLLPFQNQIFRIPLTVKPPPITMIGDTIKMNAVFLHSGDEVTPDDNSIHLCQTVVGSYDPNDIFVKEGETIIQEQVDDFLHYRIRFQNTGTWLATNVRVENQLDENLDWSTLQIEYTSHDSHTILDDNGLVNFQFNNINLPDSTHNEIESHGYIQYKIKPISSLMLSDKIRNTADIYFDFNEAIITNTVVTELVAPTSVDDIPAENILIYPSITTGQLFIKESNEINELLIYDIHGRLQEKYTQPGRSIDISHLNIGSLICVTHFKSGSQRTYKIIKTE